MPPGSSNADADTDRVARLAEARGLPEIALGTSYGKPSLKVRGRAFATVREAGLLVLHCPLEMKEVLMEMAPEIYFETDHYKGWTGLLIRLPAISDEELGLRLEDAWRFRAPPELQALRPTVREQ